MSKPIAPGGGPLNTLSEERAKMLYEFLVRKWMERNGVTGDIVIRKRTPEEKAALERGGSSA